MVIQTLLELLWMEILQLFLVAIVLYAYGSGAIKGFAVTISIGILTSMLTSIVGTHGIYQAIMPKIAKKIKTIKKWFGVA